MDQLQKRIEAQSIVISMIGHYLCKTDPIFEETLKSILSASLSDNEEVDEIIKAELRNLINFQFN